MSRFRSFLRSSIPLPLKLIAGTVFWVLLVSAIFGWFFLPREKAALLGQLEERGRWTALLLNHLVERTAGPTGLPDRSSLQRIAERMVSDEEIAEVSFFHTNGESLAHAVKTNVPSDDRVVYRRALPIQSKEGQVNGTLQIGFSLHRVNRQIDDMRKNFLLLSLGLAGLGGLIALISSRILLLPITKLVAAMDHAAGGDWGQTVTVRSGDKMGDLEKAFNRMTVQMKKSMDHLQRNVEERTRQMAETADEMNQARASHQRVLKDLKSAQRELEKFNRKLSEVDMTKLIFIGIASHELKTPLTAIKANIDFILTEKEGKLPEQLKSHLSTIQRNTNRIQGRIDRLLELTRIKSGKLHLYREPIRLAAVVAGYVDETRSEDKQVSVQVEIPEDITIYADKNGLHDIFTNLLSNAFKFASDGGQIHIIASPKDEYVLHEIRDTGIGIPEDKIERVFDEFFQVDSKRGGTGLGLTITKRLVEEQDGKIWVESQMGKGSSFFFTLPRPKENQDGRANPS